MTDFRLSDAYKNDDELIDIKVKYFIVLLVFTLGVADRRFQEFHYHCQYHWPRAFSGLIGAVVVLLPARAFPKLDGFWWELRS